MRVRIIRRPTESTIDGISLAQFELGAVYALPVELATVMIVEGWAEPVAAWIEPKLPAIRFSLVGARERRRRMYSDWRLRAQLGLASDRRRRRKE